MLNVVTLQPGQAMYLDACTPHAYVRGTGLEIMANSDNVLRAGLTPKYIDVAELLDCTRFVAKPDDQILLAPSMEGAVQHFEVPVPDFTFSVYPAGEHQLTTASAEILFAIDEAVILKRGDDTLRLEKGQSAFIPTPPPLPAAGRGPGRSRRQPLLSRFKSTHDHKGHPGWPLFWRSQPPRSLPFADKFLDVRHKFIRSCCRPLPGWLSCPSGYHCALTSPEPPQSPGTSSGRTS